MLITSNLPLLRRFQWTQVPVYTKPTNIIWQRITNCWKVWTVPGKSTSMLWHIWRRGWSQVPLILNFLITILILDLGYIFIQKSWSPHLLWSWLWLSYIFKQNMFFWVSTFPPTFWPKTKKNFSTQVDLPRGEQGLLCLNSSLSSLHMQGFSFLSFTINGIYIWRFSLQQFTLDINFPCLHFFPRQTQSQRNQYHEKLFVLFKACTSPLKLWPADKVWNFIL